MKTNQSKHGEKERGKKITTFQSTLSEEKKSAKNEEFVLPVTNFFADYFFYRRLIFINEYSYRHFFYKREHFAFSNLKIPLAYLFHFKSD